MDLYVNILRVLKVGGRYYCVTLAQKSVLQCLLDNFKEGWVVRLHTLAIEQDAQTEFGGDLPVFVMVMTKMMQVPGRDAIKVCVCKDIQICLCKNGNFSFERIIFRL